MCDMCNMNRTDCPTILPNVSHTTLDRIHESYIINDNERIHPNTPQTWFINIYFYLWFFAKTQTKMKHTHTHTQKHIETNKKTYDKV